MSPNRCLVVLPSLLSGGYAIVSTKLCTLKGTGLNSTASIALSGMNAAQTQLRASAHNVANLGTDGFRRQQVQQTPQAGGGVETSITRADTAGSDLVRDVVTQLAAKNAFLANLAVFKTSNRMAGALLDARA
jgi:flagellar hook-associated protein FlgK